MASLETPAVTPPVDLAGDDAPIAAPARGTVHAPGVPWRQRLTPLFFLAPALLAFSVYVLYPAVDSILLSFQDWDGLGQKTFVGLGNYRELFADPVFLVALKNNAIWLALYMLAPGLGLALALFLNQTMTGMRLVKSLFFFPFVLSQVVVGLVFSWFYHPDFGLLNRVLTGLGFAAVNPLQNEQWVTVFIVLAGLWPQIAYCMVLYLTGLNNVDPQLIEAGSMDGAKGWTMFWHVVLPQLRPASFLALVVTVIGALRSFDLVAIMTNGGPYNRSTVLAYYMYEQAFFSFRMGYGAAIATVLFFIMLLYISFFLYYMLRRELNRA